jgi:flavin reductase (DIM6/NTAB) family NADH-FMN oxidoreductase RutF
MQANDIIGIPKPLETKIIIYRRWDGLQNGCLDAVPDWTWGGCVEGMRDMSQCRNVIPADGEMRTQFVAAMRRNATSVNVITTAGRSGRFGITVSAFSSVSAEPPTLLICVNRRSPACRAIRSNGKFAVNILNESQSVISETFAGRTSTHSPFDFGCCSWLTGESGMPLVQDAVASLECVLEAVHEVRSHVLFIGGVISVRCSEHLPLLYSCRRYGQLSRVCRAVEPPAYEGFNDD